MKEAQRLAEAHLTGLMGRGAPERIVAPPPRRQAVWRSAAMPWARRPELVLWIGWNRLTRLAIRQWRTRKPILLSIPCVPNCGSLNC
jgi:hypothetical protein